MGVKGRSGPPGNLNSCKYPWRSFWKRRALRPEHRFILKLVEQYRDGLLSDKPDASETERSMMQVAEVARGCVLLILSEAAKKGYVRAGESGWDLMPGLAALPKFLSVERQALRDLGLERRAKRAPLSLSDYLSARAPDSGDALQLDAGPEDLEPGPGESLPGSARSPRPGEGSGADSLTPSQLTPGKAIPMLLSDSKAVTYTRPDRPEPGEQMRSYAKRRNYRETNGFRLSRGAPGSPLGTRSHKASEGSSAPEAPRTRSHGGGRGRRAPPLPGRLPAGAAPEWPPKRWRSRGSGSADAVPLESPGVESPTHLRPG